MRSLYFPTLARLLIHIFAFNSQDRFFAQPSLGSNYALRYPYELPI